MTQGKEKAKQPRLVRRETTAWGSTSESPETPAAEVDLGATEEVVQPEEAPDLQALLEEQRQQTTLWHERCLRAMADLENVRKRERREREQGIQRALLGLLTTILPVLDHLELALQTESTTGLREGVAMVHRQFLETLKQAGLEPIQSKGQLFDPHQHNAVGEVESRDCEPGRVLEELQQGYRFGERLVRPAMVRVSVAAQPTKAPLETQETTETTPDPTPIEEN